MALLQMLHLASIAVFVQRSRINHVYGSRHGTQHGKRRKKPPTTFFVQALTTPHTLLHRSQPNQLLRPGPEDVCPSGSFQTGPFLAKLGALSALALFSSSYVFTRRAGVSNVCEKRGALGAASVLFCCTTILSPIQSPSFSTTILQIASPSHLQQTSVTTLV